MMKKVIIFVFLCCKLIQVHSFQYGETFPWEMEYDHEFENNTVGSPSSSSDNVGKSPYSHSEKDDKLLESSLSHVEHDNTNHSCREKLDWFKNTTLQTISLYHKHTLKLKELHIKPEIMKHLEAGHTEFQMLIVTLMGKNEEDLLILSSLSDAADRLAFCREQVEWYMIRYEKLTAIVREMYGDEVENQIDSDDTLFKVFYYVSIISKRKNAFKSMEYLTKELNKPAGTLEEMDEERNTNEHVEVEPERKISADDYDESTLDHQNPVEEKLSRAIHDLTDDSAIRDAENLAEQRLREQNIQHIEAQEHEAKILRRA